MQMINWLKIAAIIIILIMIMSAVATFLLSVFSAAG
ncbi:hypothetical protein ALNOE001_15070 [Candidatus Methanobinarius endosymbioticus]|uniref:Uncharacterized protein n=1 Tax=Candidatus Methanobinarius endosymbioticus TaxID=2006182 RepID=A0A366M998_9EURY|nr:hypothetical protein ALNOE001_15070 [Candidatus Methanobinarius endosymbioticus]